MKIDVKVEKLIPISEVPNHLPRFRGRKKHLASVYRWLKSGLSGTLLESVYIGGSQFTSEEALNRFFAAVTEAKRRRRALLGKPSGNAHSRAMMELSDL